MGPRDEPGEGCDARLIDHRLLLGARRVDERDDGVNEHRLGLVAHRDTEG